MRLCFFHRTPMRPGWNRTASFACRWIGLDESQARSLFSTTVADLFEIELPILK